MIYLKKKLEFFIILKKLYFIKAVNLMNFIKKNSNVKIVLPEIFHIPEHLLDEYFEKIYNNIKIDDEFYFEDFDKNK